MSKILDATCDENGTVTCEGVPVQSAIVLSEGKQASEGLMFIDRDKARYLTSSASDIKTTLEKMILVIEDLASVLTTISTTLTSIGAGMLGPATAPPGTLATDVASIVSKVSELNATKAELETLKDALK